MISTSSLDLILELPEHFVLFLVPFLILFTIVHTRNAIACPPHSSPLCIDACCCERVLVSDGAWQLYVYSCICVRS